MPDELLCIPSRQTYCENNASIDGGGWAMAWKHSYWQVDKSRLSDMSTFSSFSQPCLNMKDGWCNVVDKQPSGYTEQMIAAYHDGILVYAYKAALNPALGKTIRGPYLSTTNMIVDRCKWHRGTRPSVSFHSGKFEAFDEFDKVSPENFLRNCDTVDGGYKRDCRWENCGLPFSISPSESHVQMTVVIYIRWELSIWLLPHPTILQSNGTPCLFPAVPHWEFCQL